jgi:hypothetical protein
MHITHPPIFVLYVRGPQRSRRFYESQPKTDFDHFAATMPNNWHPSFGYVPG